MKAYKYTEKQIAAFEEMARWRNSGKPLTRLYRLGDDGTGGHFLGVVGEYTVALHCNGFFDPLPHPQGDKHAPDVVRNDGTKIAVKTTPYSSPPIFKVHGMHEIEQATHLALCHYERGVCTIAWIVPKCFFMDNYTTQDFGYGERFCLSNGRCVKVN